MGYGDECRHEQSTGSAGRGPCSGARDGPGDLGDLGLDPDELPDGLVVADETGRVICFNAAAGRITAVPADDALGSRWRRPSR